MTELLERAVAAVRGLPAAAQDEIGRLVLQLAGDDEPQIALSDDERAAISRSRAAVARRRICPGRTGVRSLGKARLVKVRYTFSALADLVEILNYEAARSTHQASCDITLNTSFNILKINR